MYLRNNFPRITADGTERVPTSRIMVHPALWLPRLRFDPHRQREIERRALARLGFHPDPPAVHLDNLLGDRQAEAGSALLARDRAVGLLELLKNLGLIGYGNTGTRVAYRNREGPIRCRCPDRHLALVGELDGVPDEVEQDLGEPPSVSATGRKIRRDLGLEGQPLLGGTWLYRRHNPMHHVGQGVIVERERELARLDLR